MQKSARLSPVATHGAVGDAEQPGDLLFGEATEVAVLHHLREPGVGSSYEPLQSVFERQHYTYPAGKDASMVPAGVIWRSYS